MTAEGRIKIAGMMYRAFVNSREAEEISYDNYISLESVKLMQLNEEEKDIVKQWFN